MVRLLLCLLGWISRCALMGAAKTAKAHWGELSLQSLLKMSLGSTRSTRRGEAMLVEKMLVETTGMFW
jgi:hypothetical protein